MSLRFDHIREEHRDSAVALRFFILEEAYQSNITHGMLMALAFHVCLAILGGILVDILRLESTETISLGYEGPTRTLEELEIIEPNSVQSYFFQRERTGVMAAPEYSIAEPLELEPGPQPVPVRQIKKEQEMPRVLEVPEKIELVEPLVAYHKPTSLSESFVILKAVKPFYPEYEKQRSIQALLKVAMYVTAEGRIENATITEIKTDPEGASPAAFELATLEAMRQWRVRPALVDGKPRGKWLYVDIGFDINGVSTAAEVSW